jgi:catechol 2,3-dioxygenase-like lactoylglutathione lyase family enzyme
MWDRDVGPRHYAPGMATEVQVAVDCVDPARLVGFWADLLGYEIEAAGPEWASAVDPDGVGPRLLFHRVPEEKVVKNRLHLDVRVGGPRGTPKPARRPVVDAAVTRLVAVGATHVRTDDDEVDYFAVLLDPDGNEFCVC